MASIIASKYAVEHHAKGLTAEPAAAQPEAARPETYEQRNARETKLLATITGVSILILLVFFLAMMVILSGHSAGPVV